MNRILIIASSVVFAISMVSLSTKPSHSPAWPSGEQIAHGIIAIAILIVALVLIVPRVMRRMAARKLASS